LRAIAGRRKNKEDKDCDFLETYFIEAVGYEK
jgi:hypothetical protein